LIRRMVYEHTFVSNTEYACRTGTAAFVRAVAVNECLC
jgi:hypothetical protein